MSRRKLPAQFSRVKGSSMLLFKPNADDVKEAYIRAEKLGVKDNSFTKGAGRMVGFLGEVAFEKLYPEAKYVGGGSYTHDYELGKRTIDVKSKKCKTTPQPDFTASVNCSKTKQLKASTYFFTRVHESLSEVWVLGWAPASAIQCGKNYKRRGETDAYGFKYKVNGYHVEISTLRRANSLK